MYFFYDMQIAPQWLDHPTTIGPLPPNDRIKPTTIALDHYPQWSDQTHNHCIGSLTPNDWINPPTIGSLVFTPQWLDHPPTIGSSLPNDKICDPSLYTYVFSSRKFLFCVTPNLLCRPYNCIMSVADVSPPISCNCMKGAD